MTRTSFPLIGDNKAFGVFAAFLGLVGANDV
jgi:hypothetical protein